MKQGYLSQYFNGVVAKRLSTVEINLSKSNQHEFNGIAAMKELFGKERQKYSAKFIFLDDEHEPICDTGFLTWYDAREKHPTRSEYRLFFPTTTVSKVASVNDNLFIGLCPNNTVVVIVAAAESTVSSQLAWLFDINVGDRFTVSSKYDSDNKKLEYASKYILEQIGIEIAETSEYTYLDEMLSRFGGKFPSTKEFSSFARSTLKHIDALDNPDDVLMHWVEREEFLFKTLEKHLIQAKISEGFKDVDEFISYSLSVQNRRKSRVGQALENHLEVLLKSRNISYDRTKITENRSKPDFIFPSIAAYHDISFPVDDLTMLGVKSTCKDRWRQVLAEADRIENKHLLTLEAAISTHQTDEMRKKQLQLIVPQSIHKTYTLEQQKWLMNIESFINLLLSKQ